MSPLFFMFEGDEHTEQVKKLYDEAWNGLLDLPVIAMKKGDGVTPWVVVSGGRRKGGSRRRKVL
jgi:hypothetical protein